jgi:hypothetical protein
LPAFDGVISFAGEYRVLDKSTLCRVQSVLPASLTLGMGLRWTVEAVISRGVLPCAVPSCADLCCAAAGRNSQATIAVRQKTVAAGFNLIDNAPLLDQPSGRPTEARTIA